MCESEGQHHTCTVGLSLEVCGLKLSMGQSVWCTLIVAQFEAVPAPRRAEESWLAWQLHVPKAAQQGEEDEKGPQQQALSHKNIFGVRLLHGCIALL